MPEESQQELSSHDEKELRQKQKEEEREKQRQAAAALNNKQAMKGYLKWGVLAAAIVLLVYTVPGLFKPAEPLTIGNYPWFGPADSKVEFIIFGDFQCPFTKKFFLNTYPKIAEEYKEKIKISFRPMPTNRHANDRLSAQAAYCANDQGKFWEYAQIVFERQGRADTMSLIGYANELELDGKTFGECMQTSKYSDKVNADFKQGRKYGVSITPTVFVNGNQLYGDLPFEEYKKLVDWTITQMEA
ncbi:MAG: DsbA family protein [Candidatus Aenigmarchaeota archaeon]|nr:DsbA family protein [Candidatus Aenigmarchaeota archaeon]